MTKEQRRRMERSKRSVKKAMAPEEVAVLSNIQSLIGELMQMSGSPSPDAALDTPSEEDVMMAKGYEGKDDEDEEDKTVKGLENTPSDGVTASDDAEERMDEVETEITEESVQEVAKTLMKLLGGKTKKKSAPAPTMTDLMRSMVEVQKSSQTQINELGTAFENLLTGMGLADQFKIAQKSVKKSVNQPNMSNDNEVLMTYIKKSLMGENTVDSNEDNSTVRKTKASQLQNNSQLVRKNLGNRSVLAGLIGGSPIGPRGMYKE